MKKKGVELSVTMVVLLIMVLVSSILVIVFVVRVPKALCNGEVQACRTSVLAGHAAEKIGIDIPSQCPGKTITFKREDPEKVNKIISAELEKCVFKFHEGRLDFSEGNLLGSAWTNQVVCFRCASFDFSDYRKKDKYVKANEKGEKLVNYQMEHNTVCARPKQSAFEYLLGLSKKVSAKEGYMFPNNVNVIDPDKNYILFVSMWKRGKWEILGEFGAIGSKWFLKLSVPEVTLGLYSELGLIQFYEERGQYYAVPSSVNLVPSDSSTLQKCDLFYQ